MSELMPSRDAGAIVQALVARLADPAFPRRDLAALRRMNPDAPGSTPVLMRLLARHAADELNKGKEDLRRWALILHGMAQMAPKHHKSELRVGRSLFGSRKEPLYAEQRLAQLLAARGPMFRAQIRRLARQVRSKDQPLDWRELARLILAEGRDEDQAERLREQIARAYYRAEIEADKIEAEPVKEPV